MIKTSIADITTGTRCKVTNIGQVVTAPYAYNSVKYLLLDTAAAGYTFYEPKPGQQFVLNGIVLTADSNVVTSCIVDIFEATAANSATIGTGIFHFEILKNATVQLFGLNILVSEGVFLNAKTNDDDVYCTMMGYYIPKIG